VVTDSQAFLKVAGDTPPGVKLTSFSILFARQKGDLAQFVEGALAIERLRPGDRVLVAGRVRTIRSATTSPRQIRWFGNTWAGIDTRPRQGTFPTRTWPPPARGFTAGPACGTAARCSPDKPNAASPACPSPTTA
jgi:hypothetical protein